ncbi:MAG: ribbon-helix-helix protein, CopG family [Micromonosporaceae bacterium]
MTVTVDQEVLADADEAARAAGISRSEYVERALRETYYRQLLARATPAPLPQSEQDRIKRTLTFQHSPDSVR